MGADASRRAPNGFTLIELLVTITIIGIAFVALFTGLSTFLAVSAAQRENSDMDTVVRQYVEQVTAPQTLYSVCSPGSPSDYSSVTLPAGFTFASGPTITYWTGTNAGIFSATCAGNNAFGVQRITATVHRSVGGARTQNANITFTKRNPAP